jgi:hypothetical protein
MEAPRNRLVFEYSKMTLPEQIATPTFRTITRARHGGSYKKGMVTRLSLTLELSQFNVRSCLADTPAQIVTIGALKFEREWI